MSAAAGFRAAVERADIDAMVAALDPEVRLHSPVTFRPFEGRDAVRVLFEALMATFEDFRYVRELEGDRSAMLEFRARVGDREIHGIDLVRFGPDGLIDDFVVMVRPLSAVTKVAEEIGARLAAGAPAGDGSG